MPVNNVDMAPDVTILYPDLVNIYGCSIGAGTRIGPFVEIQRNVTIGAKCKISSHSFVCEGVTIEDEVFIGHGVMFTNDIYPRATTDAGALLTDQDWDLKPILVRRNAAIGSNVTIIGGIVIGAGAIVGAGAVVTKDVPEHAIAVGNPARVIGDARERAKTATLGRDAEDHAEPLNGGEAT